MDISAKKYFKYRYAIKLYETCNLHIDIIRKNQTTNVEEETKV